MKLTIPSIHILILLLEGDKHGYKLMQDCESVSGVKIGPATLYRSLAALVKSGLIELHSGHGDDHRRIYYRLTTEGINIVLKELEQLRRLIAFADEKFPSSHTLQSR